MTAKNVRDRRCVRCGQPGYTEEKLAQLEEDAECLVWPGRPLYALPDGACCRDCMKLAERRTKTSQCARCRAQPRLSAATPRRFQQRISWRHQAEPEHQPDRTIDKIALHRADQP